jgi:glycine/D-amino acid oxidase-like deaminating enzyme/nitrite reductase/ring-hydroxylating ferredoxin subunit
MEEGYKINGLTGRHISYWIDTTPQTNYPALENSLEVDTAVVGGGIAGITAAYLLKNSGKTVAVIESNRIISGATGHTTAKVTSQHRFIYSELFEEYDENLARMYAQSQQTALEFIATLAEAENIDCDLSRSSAFIYTETKHNLEKIKKEAEIAQKLDLPAYYTEELDLPYSIKGAVGFKNQAHFHPRKYLQHLAGLVPGDGSYIFENTRVLKVDEENGYTLTSDKGKVVARDVVIATHYPILNKGAYFTRITPLRSYALGIYIDSNTPKGMYIDYSDPLYSIRLQPTDKGEMLIITGFEHKTGKEPDTQSCYRQLAEISMKKFTKPTIAYYWSTQDNYTPDHVPFIGRYSLSDKHLFVATGFEGWGMTNGTLAGMIISDLILKRENPWVDLYNPSRGKQFSKVGELASKNIDVAKTFIKDRYLKKENNNSETKNTGQVKKIGGEKTAVYKDEKGMEHKFSAVCTHMGCIVNFNKAEQSWDCPCHGSRFDSKGKVVNSPAIKNLEKK